MPGTESSWEWWEQYDIKWDKHLVRMETLKILSDIHYITLMYTLL